MYGAVFTDSLLINYRRERLYFATGYGLIQCVKALMSYDDNVSHYAAPFTTSFKSFLGGARTC